MIFLNTHLYKILKVKCATIVSQIYPFWHPMSMSVFSFNIHITYFTTLDVLKSNKSKLTKVIQFNLKSSKYFVSVTYMIDRLKFL